MMKGNKKDNLFKAVECENVKNMRKIDTSGLDLNQHYNTAIRLLLFSTKRPRHPQIFYFVSNVMQNKKITKNYFKM